MKLHLATRCVLQCVCHAVGNDLPDAKGVHGHPLGHVVVDGAEESDAKRRHETVRGHDVIDEVRQACLIGNAFKLKTQRDSEHDNQL
jgi:hypothetical protein